MKLCCDGNEVEPPFPGKAGKIAYERNPVVNVADETFDGLYKYSADAITAKCRKVKLEVFSEKDPDRAETLVLKTKDIGSIVSDFAPYMALHDGHN